MKLLDINWVEFFERVPAWGRVSLKTRQRLSKLKRNQGVVLKTLGDDVEGLLDAKILVLYTDGRRVRIHQESYEFFRAIRAMCRCNILDSPDGESLILYLGEHFTNEQRAGLCPDRQSYYYEYDQSLARHAMSEAWLREFLALSGIKDSGAWESKRQPNYYGPARRGVGLPLLNSAKELANAKTVIERFMTWPDPVPFAELPDRFKDLSLPQLSGAMYAGMRYLLLFPAMRFGDMTPTLTLWPTISKRLHRAASAFPASVKPKETFRGAFLMEDMTTTLIAASSEPLRLRSSDNHLFAKTRQQLESDVGTLPDWVASIDGCSESCRVDMALVFLERLGFVQTKRDRIRKLHVEPTAHSEAWLGLSGKEQLKHILDSLNGDASSKQAKRGRFEIGFDDDTDEDALYALSLGDDHEGYVASFQPYRGTSRLGLVPLGVQWEIEKSRDLDLAKLLIDAYRALPDHEFVGLGAFIEYGAVQANPLIKRVHEGRPVKLTSGWPAHEPTEEELEGFWARSLVDFLRLRLLPLGCVGIGLTGNDGARCISLTDVGRYLFKLSKDFAYDDGQDGQAQVVIQPNFDVVFLSPAPLAEAAFARFSERRGRGAGALFSITRKSIIKAASCGMTSDRVLDTLRKTSTKTTPPNVAHEIKNWFDQCKRVTARTAILIHCQDSEAAQRVIALGGKKIKPISETVLELTDRKFKSTLFRKLKDVGVFVGQA